MTDEEMATTIERLLVEMRTVIVGQQRPLERMLVCMLARGHCLLESVPGLAKTLAIETLAKTVGGTFARIQFTPDLLPSDITGTRVYRGSSERFDVELGPVFVNFLLTDEINRAPAKVQSALLEVMAEQQVSIGGTTYPVPTPFVVMATQNPIESDGVYQLPDAQRDRFLMKVTLGYPDHAEEISIVERMAVSEPEPRQIIDLAQLVELQRKCDEVLVDRSVLRYAVDLVHATRDPEAHQLADLAPLLAIGASPRATLGLIRAAKALAAMRGRSYASPQDVFEVAPEILRHRLVLTYDALAREVSVEHVLQRLMATVPAAWVHPGRAQSLPDPGIAH
ncbi:MAG TPA: MoxR family ATPase [Ilumatobacteraceae bacterium]